MEPFRVHIPQTEIDDLNHRLATTRWPAPAPTTDWDRGVPLHYLKELAHYWHTTYDWRAHEARINALPQYTTTIDGTTIHYLHVPSPHPHAVPLLMTHGWPSSFIEFVKVIEPLTNPIDPDHTPFHLVIPAIPGFGFSNPTTSGWNLPRVAQAWATLMRRLGYSRYVLQGGDLGAFITLTLAGMDPEHVLGAHVNFLITPPPPDPAAMAGLSPSDQARLGLLARFDAELSGYMKVQTTRPQTLGYGLTDSPVGQLAWIVEKFHDWADTDKVPEDAVDRDQMLTNVMLYWLTRAGATSANFYFDIADVLPTAPTPPSPPPPLTVPFGVAVYPRDPAQPIRRFAEPAFPNIVHWREYDRGGHFPAMEVPELFVDDLRAFGAILAR